MTDSTKRFIICFSSIFTRPSSELNSLAISLKSHCLFRFKMTSNLLPLLRLYGRLPAGELAQRLGVSRATLMRQVRAAGEDVVVRGRTRRTTYAARRALRGSKAALPLFRVDAQGVLHDIARLDLTHPDGCAVEFLAEFGWPLDEDARAGWFDGLPYPMQDMRPQGFLGRNFAYHYAGLLQVPEDPTAWSDDHALHAMSVVGSDLLGDLIVGEAACRQWLERVQAAQVAHVAQGHEEALVSDRMLARSYARLADLAMARGLAGSSAGGEFPKFEAVRRLNDGRVQHVLVKFSGSDDSPGTQRWADLLVCEHLAGQVLHAHLDVRAAPSRIHRHAGRTFLEVERFDRHGRHGRSGVASWASLNGAMFGLAGVSWVEAARQLVAAGWLPPEDARRIARLWHFGQLIANTDMHEGNLSFQPQVVGGRPGLRVAPAYDMLPMLYAPLRGVELPRRDFQPRLPLPAERELWAEAAQAARVFWETTADDARISADFRARCAENASRLGQAG